MAKSDSHEQITAVVSRLAADLKVELAVGTKVTEQALAAAANRFVQLGWADFDYIANDIGATVSVPVDADAEPSAEPEPTETEDAK